MQLLTSSRFGARLYRRHTIDDRFHQNRGLPPADGTASASKRMFNPGISEILGNCESSTNTENAKMLPHCRPTLDRFSFHGHKFSFTGTRLTRRTKPSIASGVFRQNDRSACPIEDCVPAEPTTQPNVRGMLKATIWASIAIIPVTLVRSALR